MPRSGAFKKRFKRTRERDQPKTTPSRQSPHPRSPAASNCRQVQPHPELIERETHGHAIQQRDDFRRAPEGPAKNTVTAHRRQQENAVVQMMNVGAVQEEIQVRHLTGHDQKHKHPRQNECQMKPNKARRASRCAVSRCMMCSGVHRHSILRFSCLVRAGRAINPADDLVEKEMVQTDLQQHHVHAVHL